MHATLPPNLRGWDTGTLEVSNVSFTADESSQGDFEAKATKLRIITSEQVEQLSKKEADVQGSTVTWEMDQFRLPVYSRYQSSVVFELGKDSSLVSTLGIKPKPEAMAILWLQDLTDDIEQEVKLPVIVSEDFPTVRQNVINDQTAKHHDFKIVGWLTTTLKLDSGLDEDHESLRLSQARRHALEAYDHIEGEAELAKKQATFDDDGVIDKHEQKEIDRAHKRQLESRGRGPAQVKAYRSAKWMLRGVKDRLPTHKPTTRERESKLRGPFNLMNMLTMLRSYRANRGLGGISGQNSPIHDTGARDTETCSNLTK
jgi:hypothetical protein